MNKNQQLILMRGARAKLSTLQTLIRTHYNAEGWDTDEYAKQAVELIDQTMALLYVLQNELA